MENYVFMNADYGRKGLKDNKREAKNRMR